MTYRENFSIPKPGKIAGSVGNAAANAGKTVGNTAKNKLFGPIVDFFKKIWKWFKFVLSVCCCVCILGSCLMLGIPQMAYGVVSDSIRGSSVRSS